LFNELSNVVFPDGSSNFNRDRGAGNQVVCVDWVLDISLSQALFIA